jgi:molybdenum cofactor cytidylyltransferase
MCHVSPNSFGVAILAAGASSRMGRQKLLLPWRTTTVLGHLLAQWKEVGAAQIAVVYGYGNTKLAAELDRLGVSLEQHIVNPEPVRGMFSSIQCAAGWDGWLPELKQVVIALGDQPHLPNGTLRAVVEFAAQNPERICQPSRAGRARHPVFFPRTMLESLAAAAHGTMKEFLAAQTDARRCIEIDDPGLDLDLDTPADYDTARRLYP